MKHFYFLFLLVLFCSELSAQVAVDGTSDNFDKVYWLTWDDSVEKYEDFPDNRDGWWSGRLQERTYVWYYADDIRIIADVRDLDVTLKPDDPDGNLGVQAYTPGTWEGDGLGWLYAGYEDPDGYIDHGNDKISRLGVPNSGLVTGNDGALVNFSIDIRLEFKIEGEWRDVPYPGMVIADAEELNGSNDVTSREYISAKIKNSGSDTEWQLIDKIEKVNEDGEVNSENYHVTFNTDDEGLQTFRLEAFEEKIGNLAVFFARGATGLRDVEMKGGGKTALALGFVLPFDVSTAEEYCSVRHYIDDFKPVDVIETENTNLRDLDETPLNPIPTVYIGSSQDPLENNSIEAEQLEINFTQDTIAIDVQVTNTKSESATLYWWMDFNNDKIYADDEVKIFEDIAPGESSLPVRLLFTEKDFPGEYIGTHLRVGELHSRLRITTTVLQDNSDNPEDDRSCALAMDGEVEDYVFNVRGISISGNVFIDADGLSDGAIDNEFSGELLEYSDQMENPLYAYLMRAADNSIAGITNIEHDGSYHITNMNHGSYVLALSQFSYNLESIFPADSQDHLPNTWSSVGESLGVLVHEDALGENLLDETIDARVPIETPDAGWDIRAVNFGLNQPPVVADVSVFSEAYQTLESAVLDLAIDHQGEGSIDRGSLKLLNDIGEPVTSLTTPEGTFEITEDFSISFKPVNSFHGDSVSIRYLVADLAEMVSLPGLLQIEVGRPRKILTNPMLPSKAY